MNDTNYTGIAAAMLLDPVKAWETAGTGITDIKSLRNKILLPAAIIISVSAFGGSLIFINSKLSAAYSVLTAIRCFIAIWVTVYATAWIFKETAFPMDLGRDYSISFSVILFSSIPFFICQFISRFFESFMFLNILGLYGLYIFWAGTGRLMKAPKYKKLPLAIYTTIAMAVIYFASDFILEKLADKIYYSLFS
jgi:hypothetical protein